MSEKIRTREDRAKAERAFRQRVQAQSLSDRVGGSVDVETVMRFRAAGTWRFEIRSETPDEVEQIIRDRSHPERIILPEGPLVVVQKEDERWVLEISDHLLSSKPTLRAAAFEYFTSGTRSSRKWLSPHTHDMLIANRSRLLSSDERTWIAAALEARDWLARDFELALAGVRQSTHCRFSEGYSRFLKTAMRPDLQILEQIRLSLYDGHELESDPKVALDASIQKADSLRAALDIYLARYGFVPLTAPLSAADAIDSWLAEHADTDVWETVWQWANEARTPVAQLHAVSVFLNRPQWAIGQLQSLSKRIDTLAEVLLSDESSRNAAPWKLRAQLQLHYQRYLESLAPGLRGDMVADLACWFAENAAVVLGEVSHEFSSRLRSDITKESSLSRARWYVARTQVTPAPLRATVLWSHSVWREAFIGIAAQNHNQLESLQPSSRSLSLFRDGLAESILGGMVNCRDASVKRYMSTRVLSSDMIAESLKAASTDRQRQAALFVESCLPSEGLTLEAIEHLIYTMDAAAEPVARLIRREMFENGSTSDLGALLDSESWRDAVFQQSSKELFGIVFDTLIEWQMHHSYGSAVKVPHVCAYECERSADGARREMLFSATAWSALASDIADPIVRLAVGAHSQAIRPFIELLTQEIQQISRQSSPWVAGRSRGLVGTISNCL